MNAVVQRARVTESCELQLLFSAATDTGVWKTAIASGLRVEHFTTARTARIFNVIDQHYAVRTEPPRDSEVLIARGLARDDAEVLFDRVGCYSKAAEELTAAIIEAAAEREERRTVGMACAAFAAGNTESARSLLLDLAKKPLASGIEWMNSASIFAPLPPTPWRVAGLHIGPGRPTLLAGYGASAKTLSAQALALSCAAGAPVWGRHHTVPMNVRHIDYEQGFHATAKRYQRLAIGSGINPDEIEDRLQLCALPQVYLDSNGALDAYTRACEGADIVIIDALRGATPNQEENDSKIRRYIDHLNHVSERTGAAFLMLHHAGKPKDGHGDARTVARGSSAIFDAAGCMLLITAGKTNTEPRRVTQTKQPADAAGGPLEDFMLAIEDVAIGTDATAGVRVVQQPLEVDDAQAKADAAFERDAARLLDVVRSQPDVTHNLIVATAGMKKARVGDVLSALVDTGRVTCLPGPRQSKVYRVNA